MAPSPNQPRGQQLKQNCLQFYPFSCSQPGPQQGQFCRLNGEDLALARAKSLEPTWPQPPAPCSGLVTQLSWNQFSFFQSA
jgi:hypothetical protein